MSMEKKSSEPLADETQQAIEALLRQTIREFRVCLVRGPEVIYQTWGWGYWTTEQKALIRTVSQHSFDLRPNGDIHPYSRAFEVGLTVGNALAHSMMQHGAGDIDKYAEYIDKSLASLLNVDHTYANDLRDYMQTGGRKMAQILVAELGEPLASFDMGQDLLDEQINEIYRDSVGYALAIAESCVVEKCTALTNDLSETDKEYFQAYADYVNAKNSFSLADFQWDGIS